MSSSSSGDYTNDPVDRMFSSQRRIERGNRELQKFSNECCHTEGKTGAFVGGLIVGGIFAAIPPTGVFSPLGFIIGMAIGGVIGENCRNDNKKHIS